MQQMQQMQAFQGLAHVPLSSAMSGPPVAPSTHPPPPQRFAQRVPRLGTRGRQLRGEGKAACIVHISWPWQVPIWVSFGPATCAVIVETGRLGGMLGGGLLGAFGAFGAFAPCGGADPLRQMS